MWTSTQQVLGSNKTGESGYGAPHQLKSNNSPLKSCILNKCVLIFFFTTEKIKRTYKLYGMLVKSKQFTCGDLKTHAAHILFYSKFKLCGVRSHRSHVCCQNTDGLLFVSESCVCNVSGRALFIGYTAFLTCISYSLSLKKGAVWCGTCMRTIHLLHAVCCLQYRLYCKHAINDPNYAAICRIW